MNSSDFLIKIRTSAEVAALQSTVTQLEGLKKAAKAAGHDTSELEQQLEAANQQLNQTVVEKYTAQLRALIESERAAGRSTAELEKQLAS